MAKFTLDKIIRPQDDFFGFVNNKWLAANPIPADMPSWGSFSLLHENNQSKLRQICEDLMQKRGIKPSSIEQKVRDFYVSGINQPRVDRVALTGLQTIFSNIDHSQDRIVFSKTVGELHLMGINVFWEPYVEPDEKGSKNYALRFQQAGLSLPDRDNYFRQDKKFVELRQAFRTHVVKMFALLGVGENPKAQRAVWFVEKKLAQASWTSTRLRDVEAMYNQFSSRDLAKLTRAIDWPAYFNGLGMKPPGKVIINQPEFIKQAGRIIKGLDQYTLGAYLKWQVMRATSGALGDKFAEANFEFFGRELSGQKKIKPRWKRVIGMVDFGVGEALGRLYVDQFFPPAAQRRVKQLVSSLKTTFADRIKALDWMSPETKKAALIKLSKLTVKVGYSPKLDRYRRLDIMPSSYFFNCQNAVKYENGRKFNRVGKTVDPDDWYMTPPTVNAYNNPMSNEIVFPAGILQPPFFDYRADDAVNYGGIGSVIGHEITHGFDDKGCLYDEVGNLREWRSKRDKAAFTKRAKVMENQAANYTVLPGHKLNGKLTLGENIADLGGVEIAHAALMKALLLAKQESKIDGFTPVQRFFLGLARCESAHWSKPLTRQFLLFNPHSPPRFRVNGIVRNADSFYMAFNVKPGDKLYLAPDKRVRIW